MTIARRRSIKIITDFRSHYFADHPDATWNEAGLAYMMLGGRQTVGGHQEQMPPVGTDPGDYATFIDAARGTDVGVVAPPHGLKWSQAPALIKATLGI